MRIGVLTAQIPFENGRAKTLASNLVQACRTAGHEADLISIPFNGRSPEQLSDQMLACRLLDLTESCGTNIDCVIGLRFPAYLIPHPSKVLWLVHQHRSAYDLWNTPYGDLHPHPQGADAASLIRRSDRTAFREASRILTISTTVSERLRRFNGVGSEPLRPPPPHADRFAWIEDGDFFILPDCIDDMGRQDLALTALTYATRPVKLVLTGDEDQAIDRERLEMFSHRFGSDRVRWLGRIGEDEKYRLYGSCLGVIAIPFDEDYGYAALEAMLSGKPVITCSDSGGMLDFVVDGQTGLVCQPEPQAVAQAMDQLWDDRSRARELGASGRTLYESMNFSWGRVVENLLG